MSDQQKDQLPEKQKICPACGMPTGGYVPCPHCGADPRVRMSMKVVALLCVVTLAIGAGYFLWHKSTIGYQPVSTADINSWMNYASVWMGGTVISGPRMDDRSISFDVQDASGKPIEVDVYASPKSLKAQDKIPAVGDNVRVFGMLRVHLDGSVELRVSSLGKDKFTGEDKFQVISAYPVKTTIRDLTSGWYGLQSLKYKRVTLEGTITKMRPLYGAKIYTLEDNEKNTVSMYIHDGLIYAENRRLDLRLLQTIRVTAGASEYRGSPQLALSSYEDIENISAWLPHEVGIENVDNTLRDNFVKVGGRIVFVEMVGESSSLGVMKRNFWLNDNDNPQIWMWESTHKLVLENTGETLKRGETVKLVGRVNGSNENLIELVAPPEVEILSVEDYEPPFVENVTNINGSLEGDFVTVEGKITKKEGISAGIGIPSNWKFTLRDNFGGEIGVWIPNTIYERIPESDIPAVGDNLRVVGKVVKREGETQVQPGVPSDVMKR